MSEPWQATDEQAEATTPTLWEAVVAVVVAAGAEAERLSREDANDRASLDADGIIAVMGVSCYYTGDRDTAGRAALRLLGARRATRLYCEVRAALTEALGPEVERLRARPALDAETLRLVEEFVEAQQKGCAAIKMDEAREFWQRRIDAFRALLDHARDSRG